MMHNPFLGNIVRSLIHELELLSDKKFRSECYLDSDEKLKAEERIEFSRLVHGKISVVPSLHELQSLFHGVEQFLLYNHQVQKGYERVAEKYYELLSRRWVIAVEKYKDGYDPDPNRDFKIWAYGLITIDQTLLDEIRSALQEAEKRIEESFPEDLTIPFRIDYLTNDLIKAGLPISGLNIQDTPTPQSDATLCEYIELDSGKYVRITMPENIILTSAQKVKAREIALTHEILMEKHDKVCDSMRLSLLRDGLTVSSVRINRSEYELVFNPGKFVSIDTELGILEIRVFTQLQPEQRERIRKVATEKLNAFGIKISETIKSVRKISSKTRIKSKSKTRFEVALSFPGEARDLVEQVADGLALKISKDKIFYDKFYEAELARPNLDTYLQKIYHEQSKLVVIFLCADYESKEWCGLEWRAIRDLIKKRQDESIMLFRLDDTDISGLFSIDGYIDARDLNANEIVDSICKRV